MHVHLSIKSELLEGRPLMAPSTAHFTGAQEEMPTASTSQVVRPQPPSGEQGGGPAQLSMEELGRGLMSLHWGQVKECLGGAGPVPRPSDGLSAPWGAARGLVWPQQVHQGRSSRRVPWGEVQGPPGG